MQGKDGSASMKVFLLCISFYKKNFYFDESLYVKKI